MRIYSNDNVEYNHNCLVVYVRIKIYNRFDYGIMYFTLSFVAMEVLNIKELVIYCDCLLYIQFRDM